jgi:hypothetical protein
VLHLFGDYIYKPLNCHICEQMEPSAQSGWLPLQMLATETCELYRPNVLARAAKFLVLFLLIFTIGGQWAVLQSFAWMGMLIDYSRYASVSEAIVKTFDGQHPCNLCKAIDAGKKSETKSELSLKLPKLEFPPHEAFCAWLAPVVFSPFPPFQNAPSAARAEPQTPPPRFFVA